MGQLRFLDESALLQTRELESDKFTIGRDEECDLTIPGELASRVHAQLTREPDGRWRLKDLQSRNKTFLNGQVVGEALLSPGDVIRIGDRILEYCEGSTRPIANLREHFITDRKDPPGSEWIKMREPAHLSSEQMEKLSALVEQSGVAPRVEDLADLAMSRLLIDLAAERGLVALKGDEAKGLELISVRGLGARTGATAHVGISQSFIYSGLLQHVAGRYPSEAANGATPEQDYPSTAMVAPLVSSGREIGVIYVDRPLGRRPFSLGDLYFMMGAGAVLGSAITRAQRRLSSLVGDQAPAYLSVSRRMQTELFVLPSGGELFQAGTRLMQGAERCGDLQETILLDDKRLVLVMTDAGGMGISGFVHSMSIYAGLRVAFEAQEETVDLGSAFQAVNRTLSHRAARQLVGCAAVLIDVTAGRLAYINAGLRPPLLLLGPQRLVTLDKESVLLGVDAESLYEPTFADLTSRFRVALYSDGVTDALNPAGESYGEERLHEFLLQPTSFDTPDKMIDGIIGDLERHVGKGKPADDALVLVAAHG